MPEYNFECQACRKPFTIEVSMSQYSTMQKEKKFVCPECGSKKTVRIFTAPAVLRSSDVPRSGGCGPGCCCG